MPNHLTDLQQAMVRLWNKGYHEGYNRLPESIDELTYTFAYNVGKEDRDEDDRLVAIHAKDFEQLTEEEKEYLSSISDLIDRI